MSNEHYILYLDAEGDIANGSRSPWQIAARLISVDGEPVASLNVLIDEGLGLYPSRISDQNKMIAAGIEIVSLETARNFLGDAIQILLDKGAQVTAIAWGARDFPKLGADFLPRGVTFTNAIEAWAETCPTDFDSEKRTPKGKPKVNLKSVFDFEIGGSLDWHNADADVDALVAIFTKVLARGAFGVYQNARDFVNFPLQIVYNRIR